MFLCLKYVFANIYKYLNELVILNSSEFTKE
ncbi:hypothetical protein P829_00475 [Klebsiella pneumoniae UCI 26]|nr:hypothetical protein P829_00475 [Klebsiella pneumoniae UCI 26]